MLTFPACGVTHKDFLAMRLLDVLLGGGTQSRLFRHVREEQHLAYETATDFPSQTQCSYFSVFALTDRLEMEETKSALIGELADIAGEAGHGRRIAACQSLSQRTLSAVASIQRTVCIRFSLV